MKAENSATKEAQLSAEIQKLEVACAELASLPSGRVGLALDIILVVESKIIFRALVFIAVCFVPPFLNGSGLRRRNVQTVYLKKGNLYFRSDPKLVTSQQQRDLKKAKNRMGKNFKDAL